MPSAREILERVFREEHGLIIASLIRRSGSFDLAEESLQEAFSSALANWEDEGTPKNPAAWLTTVAHRKLLDMLRREKTKNEKQPAAMGVRLARQGRNVASASETASRGRAS